MAPEWIGPYRIVRELGSGGMGTVYEGVRPPLSRSVAIKVLHREHSLDGDLARRFFNEARAACLVEHPGIVQVFEFGQAEQGRTYLVMEFLKGESLARRLLQADQFSDIDRLRIARQVADVLSAVHAAGIVHRDLKPENVMLVRDPAVPGGERVKLVDFGIAKVAAFSGEKTNSAMLMGTPLYMSPEQCRGAGKVDAKTDVHSLGIMLYESQHPVENQCKSVPLGDATACKSRVWAGERSRT